MICVTPRRRSPSGANVKVVQQMLGHASAAMTLDVYAGLFGDDLDSVADRLNALVPQMCHKCATRHKKRLLILLKSEPQKHCGLGETHRWALKLTEVVDSLGLPTEEIIYD
jgi:hypothetical protein